MIIAVERLIVRLGSISTYRVLLGGVLMKERTILVSHFAKFNAR